MCFMCICMSACNTIASHTLIVKSIWEIIFTTAVIQCFIILDIFF